MSCFILQSKEWEHPRLRQANGVNEHLCLHRVNETVMCLVSLEYPLWSDVTIRALLRLSSSFLFVQAERLWT